MVDDADDVAPERAGELAALDVGELDVTICAVDLPVVERARSK